MVTRSVDIADEKTRHVNRRQDNAEAEPVSVNGIAPPPKVPGSLVDVAPVGALLCD